MWIICIFVCLVFPMLSNLFIAALLSSTGKGLTSWLLLMMFIVFLLISHVVVSWVRCVLDLAFPDVCHLSYLNLFLTSLHNIAT